MQFRDMTAWHRKALLELRILLDDISHSPILTTISNDPREICAYPPPPNNRSGGLWELDARTSRHSNRSDERWVLVRRADACRPLVEDEYRWITVLPVVIDGVMLY